MSNQKLHPAVSELRKFLQLKGDTELTDFMSNWLGAWVDVVAAGVDVKTSAKLMFKGTEKEFKEQVLTAGLQALGIATAQLGLEASEEDIPEGKRYSFQLMALRNAKKSLLVQA